MYSGAGDTTQLVPGFPIRTPWDHSSVDSSPRPIAASHVLHRLLVPRHPPSALDNLTTENKMLASTVQFSTHNQPTTTRHPPNPTLNRKTRSRTSGIGGQVMPGRNNNPLHRGPGDDHRTPIAGTADMVVLSGPNRMLYARNSAAPATPPRPH